MCCEWSGTAHVSLNALQCRHGSNQRSFFVRLVVVVSWNFIFLQCALPLQALWSAATCH